MSLDIFFAGTCFNREKCILMGLSRLLSPQKSTGDKSQRKFYQKNKIEEGCDIRFI